MNAVEAEGGALRKVRRPPVVTQNTQRSDQDQSAFYVEDSTGVAQDSTVARTVRRHEDPLGFFRGIVFGLILDVAIVAVVVGACYLVGFLADHLPNIVLGLCIVLLGIMFGAILAARA